MKQDLLEKTRVKHEKFEQYPHEDQHALLESRFALISSIVEGAFLAMREMREGDALHDGIVERCTVIEENLGYLQLEIQRAKNWSRLLLGRDHQSPAEVERRGREYLANIGLDKPPII